MSDKPNSNLKLSTQQADSVTKVNLSVGEPKKTVSFKCNSGLWRAFVCEVKAKNLSVCHVLEPIIFGWLYGEVYLSRTIRPLNIETINIERAVKRVRRYGVELDEETVGKCHFRSCHKESIGKFRFKATGNVYDLCRFHADELVSKHGLWECVKDE